MLCVSVFFFNVRYFWGEQEAMNESFFIDSLVSMHWIACFCFIIILVLFCIETPICWPNSSGHRDISQNLRVLVCRCLPVLPPGVLHVNEPWGFPGDILDVWRATGKKKTSCEQQIGTRCNLQNSSSSVVCICEVFWSNLKFYFCFWNTQKWLSVLIPHKKCFFCPKKILTPKTGGVCVMLEDPKTATVRTNKRLQAFTRPWTPSWGSGPGWRRFLFWVQLECHGSHGCIMKIQPLVQAIRLCGGRLRCGSCLLGKTFRWLWVKKTWTKMAPRWSKVKCHHDIFECVYIWYVYYMYIHVYWSRWWFQCWFFSCSPSKQLQEKMFVSTFNPFSYRPIVFV